MRKAALLAFAAALASGSIVCAQSPARAAVVAQPILISDVTLHSDDSPLVRAAKNTVANRMREALRSTGVLINDAYIRSSTGRISQANSSAPLPKFNDKSETLGHSSPTLPNAYGADRAAAERMQQQGGASKQQMPPPADYVTADPAAPRVSQNTREIPNNQNRPNQRP